MNRCKGFPQTKNDGNANIGSGGNVSLGNDSFMNTQSTMHTSGREQTNTSSNMSQNSIENTCDNQSSQKTNLSNENEKEYYALLHAFGGMVPGLVPGISQSAYFERDIIQGNSVLISNNESVQTGGNANVGNGRFMSSQSIIQSSDKETDTSSNMGDNSMKNIGGDQSSQETNSLNKNEKEYHALFGGMVPGFVPGHLQSAFGRDLIQSDILTSSNLEQKDMNSESATTPTHEPDSELNSTLNGQQNLVPNPENLITSNKSPSTPDVVVLEHDTGPTEIKQEVLHMGQHYKPGVKNDNGTVIML